MKEKTNNLIYWNSVKCPTDLVATLSEGNHGESITKFQNGEYKSLHLEKLRNYENLYSIRVKGDDKADRLLFTCNPPSREALFLCVAENHNYNAAFREIETALKEGVNGEDFVTIAGNQAVIEAANLMEVPPAYDEAIYYGKYVFPLSDYQLGVVNNPTLPLIINGTAGSGKTVVAEQLLLSVEELDYEKAYYFAPTNNLVSFMHGEIAKFPNGKEFLDSSKVIVSTYENYVKGRIADQDLQSSGLEDFKSWYDSHPSNSFVAPSSSNKKKAKGLQQDALSAAKIYAELCIAAPYSRENYMSLGENQSSLSKPERAEIVKILTSYLGHNVSEKRIDPNLQSLGDIVNIEEAEQGLVIVDESQSFSGNAIKHAKNLSKNESILFIGDSAQSMLSSVSNAPYIKSLFYDERTKQSRVNEAFWPWSYRCPARVVKASAALLGVKQSITKEKLSSSIFVPDFDAKEDANVSSLKKGLLYFYDSEKKVKSFAEKLKGKLSTDTVIIVPSDDYIQGATSRFGTSYVVTAKEFLGMGAPNVVMYRCFEKKAATALSANDKSANLSEEEKVAINELFVSMTRSENSLSICETNPRHNAVLFEKMDLSQLHEESKTDQDIDSLLENMKISTDEEWQDKIVELITLGNEAIAHRICVHKFKDSAGEVFATCIQKAIDTDEKMPVSKASVANLDIASSGNVLPSNLKSASNENVAQTQSKKKKSSTAPKTSNIGDGKKEETIAERLSQLYQAIVKSESDKVRVLIQNIPVQDLMAYNKPNVGNLLHAAVISNKGRETHNDLGEILINHIQASNAITNNSKKNWFETKNEKGDSPIYYAALLGCDKIITTLGNTNVGIDFDITNKKNSTPVYIAAKKGHADAIDALGKCGANMNKQANGTIPAHYAAVDGNVLVIEALKKAEADLDATEDDQNFTSAHIAAQYGHANVIEALRKAKAHLDALDKENATPAHIAAQSGYASVIEALIKAKVQFNFGTLEGQMPIHLAAQNGHDTVIEALAKGGMDLNEKTFPFCNTPSHLAAQNGHAIVIEVLSKAKADFTLTNVNGMTPTHLAALCGHATTIEALGKTTAPLHLKCDEGSTPADLAVQKNHPHVITALAQAVSDNLDGDTVLHSIADSIVNRVHNRAAVGNLKNIVILGLMDSCGGDEEMLLENLQINRQDLTMENVMRTNRGVSLVSEGLNQKLSINNAARQDDLTIYKIVNDTITNKGNQR